MTTFAIDPGPTHSSYVVLDQDNKIHGQDDCETEYLLFALDLFRGVENSQEVVCEMVQHYGSGMSAGAEVFDTCVVIGRIQQHCVHLGLPFHVLRRPQIKTHLCGTPRAKDANVRQALIDLLGPQRIKTQVEKTNKKGGRKLVTISAPGPTFGVSEHRWAALAVGVTWNALRPQSEIISLSGCRVA